MLAKAEDTFRKFLVYVLEGSINTNVLEYLSRWSVWSANCGTVYDKSCAIPPVISLIPETYSLDTLSPFPRILPYLDGPT